MLAVLKRSANTKSLYVILAIILSIALIGIIGSSALAVDTQVTAEICDDSSLPDVIISEPASGSVVNAPSISIKGTTQRTSMIEILLNNQHDSYVAIGQSGILDTTINLVKGANTIKLIATYNCNLNTKELDLVAVYEPAATPSDGGTSTVTPTTNAGGTVSNPVSSNESSQNNKKSNLIERIKENLLPGGKTHQQKSSNRHYQDSDVVKHVIKAIVNWLALAVILFSVVTFVIPLQVISLFSKSSYLNWLSRSKFLSSKTAIRFTSVFIIAICLFILQM